MTHQKENQEKTRQNDLADIGQSKGFLLWIEKMGNKLPHPFWIFVWICVFIVAISGVSALFGVSTIDPNDKTGVVLVDGESVIEKDGIVVSIEYSNEDQAYTLTFISKDRQKFPEKDLFLVFDDIEHSCGELVVSGVPPGEYEYRVYKVVKAQNLVSGEGLRKFVENMVSNFAYFAPFGLVLVMLMGVSIAERSGLLTVVLRNIAFSVPKPVVLPVIFIIGACGNIGSDAGVVVVPPIAALIFAQMGFNPIAGLIAGYAGATAGFTANFFIAGTDVLLAGISTEITENLTPPTEVSATANWFFMIASTLMIAIVGSFVARKFTIPRCNKIAITDNDGTVAVEKPKLTEAERRGLRHAGWSLLVYVAVIALAVAIPGAPLRNPETGGIVPSPFLRGLVPILFFMFAIPGYFYGKATGAIKKPNDVLKQMEHGMKELSGYIVLMLVVAQFINLFIWSNLDQIIAINGAELLKSTGLTGPLMFVLFILLVAFLNIFMGSGSAKWAIFAPVFIPMLYQLNYSPAFVQLLYRIGDSITNCCTPIYVYFPLLLGWIHKYNKKVGIGTIVSLLLPYALFLLLGWIALMLVWYGLGLPIGPGEGVYLP